MVTMRRLLRTTAQAWRSTGSSKTLTPSSSLRYHNTTHRLYHRTLERIAPVASESQSSRSTSETPFLFPIVPAVLAGLFGFGLLDVAYADAEKADVKPPLPSESPSSYVDLEETARKERQRLEELLKSKGLNFGSYPRFTVAVKGQKITIKFQIPPTCEVPRLIANLVSHLGLKVEERGGGSDMIMRAWDSAVAWQLTFDRPKKQKQAGGELGNSEDIDVHEDLCILIFRSLISSDKAIILHL